MIKTLIFLTGRDVLGTLRGASKGAQLLLLFCFSWGKRLRMEVILRWRVLIFVNILAMIINDVIDISWPKISRLKYDTVFVDYGF